MRLAISNIAWRPEERDEILDVLAAEGATGLEIAPGLAFAGEPDAFAPSEVAVSELRRTLTGHGLQLVSMQSLLFGVAGAQLFGSNEESLHFEESLGRAIRLGGRLGIPNLVLGSPGNRSIPDSLLRVSAEQRACAMLRRLGELCLSEGTKLALEPNPAAYGTNFLTTIGETTAFANVVDHPAVTVNFDLGALHMNGEIGEAASLFRQARPRVSHVHVSEPQLAPVPQEPSITGGALETIQAQNYDGWFSIEMRAADGSNRERVRSALSACAHALTRRQERVH